MPSLCQQCGHASKDHCAGSVSHSFWKDEKAQDGRAKRQFKCPTRHCNQPLCSCPAFAEAA